MTTDVITAQELPAHVAEEEVRDLVIQRPEDRRLITVFDDRFDVATLTADTNPEIVETWCYAFRQAGAIVLGVSVKGVQAAVREMAKHGEVARLEELRETFEDEREVRLVGTAVRYLVNSDGVQIAVDRSIRALRQSKVQVVGVWEGTGESRRRVGEREEPDPKWYEKAYSKAVRNVLLPLVRQDAVSVIINAFKETPKYQDVLNNRTPQRETGRSSTRQQQTARAASQPAGRAAAASTPQPQAAPNVGEPPGFRDRLAYLSQTSPEVYRETLAELRQKFPHVVNGETQALKPGAFRAEDVEPLNVILEAAKRRIDGEPPPAEDETADEVGDDPEIS